MSLTRKVADFLNVEAGASGTKHVLTAGAVAVTVLAATIGMVSPAGANPCGPDAIHDQYLHLYDDHTDVAHNNGHFNDYVHDHYCEPILP